MKLFLADLQALKSKLMLRSKLLDWKEVLYDLESTGLSIRENFFDENSALELCKKVEDIFKEQSESVKIYENGIDRRIFGIERYDSSFDSFLNNNEFNCLEHAIQGYSSKVKLVMANILSSQSGSKNLGSGGGWHRDSPFRNQFKVFVFLTNVTEGNGPLTFIKGSHKADSIRRFCNELGIKKNRYRFTDAEIDEASIKLGYKPTYVTCKPGTLVFANTRGLHRGTPIQSGNRVALTNYYFRKTVPDHFNIQ